MSTNHGIEVDQSLIVLTLFHLKVRRAFPDVDQCQPISDQSRLITHWHAARHQDWNSNFSVLEGYLRKHKATNLWRRMIALRKHRATKLWRRMIANVRD